MLNLERNHDLMTLERNNDSMTTTIPTNDRSKFSTSTYRPSSPPNRALLQLQQFCREEERRQRHEAAEYITSLGATAEFVRSSLELCPDSNLDWMMWKKNPSYNRQERQQVGYNSNVKNRNMFLILLA